MDSAPAISILMPCYNYARFLPAALESINSGARGLPEGSVEVLVVNDGSTDDTRSVLQAWESQPGIRVFHEANRGVAGARNTAMAHATGRLWMFFDADDLIYPDCLPQTLAFFEQHPEVGLFFTNYDIFEDSRVVEVSGVDIWKTFRGIPHEEPVSGHWLFRESLARWVLEHGSFMHTTGFTVRAEVAREAGEFRAGYTYGEDDDYWARCAYLCRAGYLDRVLSRKRNHNASVIHDPARKIANQESLLALTRMQRAEFQAPPFERILRAKELACAQSLIWGLVESGDFGRARELLGQYQRQYPWGWPFLKLRLKLLLRKRQA